MSCNLTAGQKAQLEALMQTREHRLEAELVPAYQDSVEQWLPHT